jgi:hypothetical protein
MSEVYKGTEIAISTAKNQEKNWSARAEYAIPGEGNVRVEATEAKYATEEEARQAALRSAIESIDRMRASLGKR